MQVALLHVPCGIKVYSTVITVVSDAIPKLVYLFHNVGARLSVRAISRPDFTTLN